MSDTRYVSFLGPPGSGKTTQIRLLQERLGERLTVASVPRLLRGQPDLVAVLSPSELAQLDGLRKPSAVARDRGELAPVEVDALLLSAVSRLETPVVALDGCPRGIAQARLFLGTGFAARTTVVELRFPDDPAVMSLRRQTERETAVRGPEYARVRRHVFESKVRVFVHDTLIGLELLDAASVPHLQIDASLPADEVHERVVEAIDAATANARSALR